MKGDFSRITFDVANHFSRVLMQQGRVTLDADSNEQADILLHYLRTLARDLIGPYGGPAGTDLGFHLNIPPSSGNPATLTISAGRYYVDGILCENAKDCSYNAQPDYTPLASDPLLKDLLSGPLQAKTYWLYLDVWERLITQVEDGRIREVALGGPDTCTRTKVIWQVKAREPKADPAAGCAAPLTELSTLSSGQMAAELVPGQQRKDPCVIAPDARYRGAENQLYRVEIHQGGSIERKSDGTVTGTAPTFKWSRDNGSVATAWLGTDGNDLLVANARGFSAGNWIELSDDTTDLSGDSSAMIKLSSVDGNRLRVDGGSVPPVWTSNLKNPKVRRWDQTENDDVILTPSGAIPLADGLKPTWLDLEDGLRIQFSSGDYRTGDYWLIPARVATGEIEWSRTPAANGGSTADPLPPRGIKHHYAPLGQLTWDSNGKTWAITSCLCMVPPLGGPEPELKRPVAARASPTLPLPPPSSTPTPASPTLPLPPPSSAAAPASPTLPLPPPSPAPVPATSPSQPSETKPQESKPK